MKFITTIIPCLCIFIMLSFNSCKKKIKEVELEGRVFIATTAIPLENTSVVLVQEINGKKRTFTTQKDGRFTFSITFEKDEETDSYFTLEGVHKEFGSGKSSSFNLGGEDHVVRNLFLSRNRDKDTTVITGQTTLKYGNQNLPLKGTAIAYYRVPYSYTTFSGGEEKAEYALLLPSNASYEVTASHPSVANGVTDSLRVDSVKSTKDFELEATGAIRHFLVDSVSNNKIINASVLLKSQSEYFEIVDSGLSNNDGLFRFEHVPDGDYNLTLAKEGYANLEYSVKVQGGLTNSGTIFWKKPFPKMAIDFATINFGSKGTVQYGYVLNEGFDEFNWEIKDLPNWLEVKPLSGSCKDTVKLTFTAKRNLLGVENEANFSIQSTNAIPAVINARAFIFNNGVDSGITVTQELILEANDSVGSFEITKTGSVNLKWFAVVENPNSPLSLGFDTGNLSSQTKASVPITCNREGLPRGIYTETIKVYSNGGEAEVKVTIKVAENEQDILGMEGLTAFYPFNRNYFDWVHLSDSSFITEVTNVVPVRDRGDHKERAYMFSGDYLAIPDPFQLQKPEEFSISFWIDFAQDKIRMMEDTVTAFYLGSALKPYFQVNFIKDANNHFKPFFSIDFERGSLEIEIEAASGITNNWGFYTINRTREKVEVFYNGQPQSIFEKPIHIISTGALNANGGSSVFGCNLLRGTPHNFLDATLDEMMFFNRSLSNTEIQNIYNY